VKRIIKLIFLKQNIILAITTCLVIAGFLLASAFTRVVGFPLDDAWIHQTYARNLAELGQWAFIPGKLSAGSTAPLWSLLIAAGYLFRTIPYGWTYFLGGISLLGIGLSGEAYLHRQFPDLRSGFPWLGIFLIGEWHLVWASVSGMETALYCLFILLVLLIVSRKSVCPWQVGLLAGISVWIRPDGITLLGPIFFVLFLSTETWRYKMTNLAKGLAFFLLPFIPYLLFNHILSGSWWPNTFYAKQAEYAILTQTPLAQRLLSLFSLPMIGAGILLLPGFFAEVWNAWKLKNWAVIAAVLWWVGYTILYAVRLPVTYQHGRYLMSGMPVYFVVSIMGIRYILRAISGHKMAHWWVSRAWTMVIVGVWLAFYGIGASAYAQDVAIIDSEMVTAAKWVAVNTPQQSKIAVHDIGAFGFFSQRNLVDLAGLISPEVIPFIRDERRLEEYLDEQGVDYLVTFPKWYPQLILRGVPVYHTQGTFSPKAGGENMWVYRWRKP